MDSRSQEILQKVHPKQREIVTLLIERMIALGYDARVTQGFRTAAEQQKLYNQGRTTPGKKVTGAKPWESNHNYGFGNDITIYKNGKPDWDDLKPYYVLGREAKKLGMEWGGDWSNFDGPHVQLKGMSIKECQTYYRKGGLAAVWARMDQILAGAKPIVFIPREDELLEFGDKGAAVENLQKQLFQLNYLRAHEVDGEFGKITKNAVIGFQRQHNLTADGIVGSGTKAKLKAALESKSTLNSISAAVPPVISSQPSPTGNLPAVNVSVNENQTNNLQSEPPPIQSEQATEETQAKTPEGETQIVKTLNEQDVNQPAEVAETTPYNGIGFWATIKRDLTAVTGGNLTFQGLAEYAQQANNIPPWLVPIIGKIALIILIASVGYLLFRVIHFIVDSWKQAQRVKIEADAKTSVNRKDLIWK